MVSEGRGRLFRRKDCKYLIYLPKDLAEDSMFPFKGSNSTFVRVTFKVGEATDCSSTSGMNKNQQSKQQPSRNRNHLFLFFSLPPRI